MKKGQAYVTHGEPPLSATPEERSEPVAPPRFTSATPPHFLPRDYGMAGAVGAYDAEPLAAHLSETLRQLAGGLAECDPLECVNQALDALLPSGERHRVAAEHVVGQVLTLSLARRSDRFAYGRSLVPKLRTRLMPQLGPITITLVIR